MGRDGICLLLGEIAKATETEGTGLSLQNKQRRMLVEPFRKQAFQFFVECMKEWVLVEGRHVYDRDICLNCVKAELFSKDCCCTLDDHGRLRDKTKISETGCYVLHKRGVYAIYESDAERKMMNSPALIMGASDMDEELRVDRLLLLFRSVREGAKWAMNLPLLSSRSAYRLWRLWMWGRDTSVCGGQLGKMVRMRWL